MKRLALVLGILGLVLGMSGTASATPSHVEISGSGSSWAFGAVHQWSTDVDGQGLRVDFTSSGSAQGRKDFAHYFTDFGVSDIAYQGTDPVTGQPDTSLGRKYVYLPIVAGGTSFPYNLSYAGQRIRNLRLSGETIAKIFTNQITYWDDTEIKQDNNNQIRLPHIPIIPVVHSEGSGSTYQFTAYLAHQYPGIWSKFAGFSEPTEYFPRQGHQQAQNGSDGVMNYLTSSAGAGAIGFDEYFYAKQVNFPVAKVENSAGYFTAPTQYNVAVALTQAQIQDTNPNAQDYLTQKLDNVYGYRDPRTYPLSSYSYAILPTGTNSQDQKTNTTAQRQTLADFFYYSICEGQAEMGPIGYSPLPVNLVQDGFGQINKLKQVDPKVDLTSRNVSTCHNPTFIAGQPKVNHLAQIAPQPPGCDKAGAGPCSADVGLGDANPDAGGHAPSNSGGGHNGSQSGPGSGNSESGSGPSGSGASSGSGAATGGSGSGPSSAAAKPHIDPNTGQLVGGSGGSPEGGTGDTAGGAELVGNPSLIPATQSSRAFDTTMYVLMVLLLLALITVPVLVSRVLARPAGQRP